MNELLTIAEIKSRFGAEWVLIEDPLTNDALEVVEGRVRCHSPDRDEVYRQVAALRPARFAVLYLGRLPYDAAVVL